MINQSNNKLISIISSFSKVELNRLKKYILSPYFNSNTELTELFYIIEDQYVTGAISLNKEKVWSRIKPDTPFNDLKSRKLFSDLLKLTEQFLAQEIYEQEDLQKANYLLKSIGTRNLNKLFSTSISNAERLSKKASFKESRFYFDQYQREKNIYEISTADHDRSSEGNLVKIINNLDYFYLAEKIRYLCEMLIREDVISMEYDVLFRDEIMNHLDKYKYEDVPLVSIYYHMYLTLKFDNDDYYFNFKKLLDENLQIFPKYEAKEIYTAAINYCIKKINKGDDKFLNEFLELNESLLANNIIAENELSPWKFKNIVTVALKLSKFKWVEDFIETYKDKVSENYRDNAITFNKAQLYFYQKKYEELLPLLLQVDYEDFTYSLNSRLFTVITYYELEESDALISYLDSFRTYLKRQKSISDKRKKNYLNFLSNIRKLVRYNQNRKVDLLKLKVDITSTSDTVSKEWLLEKIDELLYLKPSQRGIDTSFNKGANT